MADVIRCLIRIERLLEALTERVLSHHQRLRALEEKQK
jgi:hypothetical protein